MTPEERKPTGLVKSATEIRQLIIDNPDLPLVVFAGEDANSGDYCYTSCSWVSASVGEFLDCQQAVNNERCYTDRDDLEENIADALDYEPEESNEEFELRVKKELAEYDPYWKPCIILYVNN